MKKIFIVILILILISSCKTKKKMSYDYKEKDKSEVITSDKKDSTSISIQTDIVTIDDIETIEETITKIEYQVITDSVSGDKQAVPKTKEIVNKKSSKGTKTVSDESVKSIDSITTKKDSTIKKDISIKEEIETKKTFNNTAIVKFIYIIGALVIGGYIIVKRYFPSIFVRVKKYLIP